MSKEKTTFILSGPLSEILQKALEIVYRKRDPIEKSVSLEGKSAQLTSLLRNSARDKKRKEVTILSLPLKELERINELDLRLKIDRDKEKGDLILYLDDSVDFTGDRRLKPLSNAGEKELKLKNSIESFCNSRGVNVVVGLQNLINHLDKNY